MENAQVSREGRTLGELDFVVHNCHENRVEHHEIAVKFYLGVGNDGDAPARWYGPNANDRLDIKTKHLLTHQCLMTERAETRQMLEDHGIGIPYPRLFMPGYLFYPADVDLPPPATTPAGHEKGSWCRVETLGEEDVHNWCVLHKPHWLGRYQDTTQPDPRQATATLNAVQKGAPPRLFAQMAPHPSGQGWEEIRRIFVVPAHWPGIIGKA